MRVLSVLLLAALAFAPACEQSPTAAKSAKVRVQAGQLTFVGGLFLDDSLNELVKPKESLRSRRTALRKPLWGLNELLKGPDLVRARSATVGVLPVALSEDGGPRTALAELIRLAGIQTVSLAAAENAEVDRGRVGSTLKALSNVGLSAIGAFEDDGRKLLAERRVDLGSVSASLFGVAIAAKSSSTRIAAFDRGQADALVAAVKGAADRAHGRKDLAVAVIGWPEGEAFSDRQALARRLVDEAGVDAVLGHNRGPFEGIERRGDGIIIHNPGPGLRCDLGGDGGTQPGFVFRLHVDGAALSWVEAQPIELHKGATKIGMGTKATHGVVTDLVKKSRELGAEVINEYGRGILDLAIAPKQD